MKRLFAYIRVSDPKQGKGVSLDEQRSIIEAYAARIGATIVEWFVEKKTAAKAGRPQFTRMVKLLRQGKADGVVIHKVDRSTRNFRDWADIDELIEQGVDIHFANEHMDLRSDGGRLAADIQMVFAVQYIRNLRQETLKGIHGRLKQGILPRGAPLGYLDRGAGKPKTIDPVRGPIIRALFERYAAGAVTLRMLTEEAERAGLRNRNGNPLPLQLVHKMLRNPFYAGVLRSSRFGVFPGAHEPLVIKATYERVQAVLAGKFIRRTKRHILRFRRLLHCKTCGRSLIGSERKDFVYYRCSNIPCPTTSVREDVVDEAVVELLASVRMGEREAKAIEAELAEYDRKRTELQEARRASLTEALSALNARLTRLIDLLIDGKIDATAHEAKRTELLLEQKQLQADLADVEAGTAAILAKAREIVGLAQSAENMYQSGDDEQKRSLLQIVLSDCAVTGKSLEFAMREPFAALAKRTSEHSSAPDWYTPRTFTLDELLKWSREMSEKAEKLLNSIFSQEEVEESA